MLASASRTTSSWQQQRSNAANRAVPSVGNDELRCEGAVIMLQRAGIKTDEFPSIDLRS